MKPENVGFEIYTDKVKLFDFGFAKELQQQQSNSNNNNNILSSSSNHSLSSNNSSLQNSNHNNNNEFVCYDGAFAGTVSKKRRL